MSEQEKELRYKHQLTCIFGAYKKQPPQIDKDGRKFEYIHITIDTEAGLSMYRQWIMDSAQLIGEGKDVTKQLKRFDECLEEYVKFAVAKMCGIIRQPIELDENGKPMEKDMIQNAD